MATKTEVFYVTTLANSSEQDFTTNSVDSQFPQHIIGVHCGVAVAGQQLMLIVNGKVQAAMDTSFFSAGNGMMETDFDVPAAVNVVLGLKDLNAAARANVPVTIKYTIPG